MYWSVTQSKSYIRRQKRRKRFWDKRRHKHGQIVWILIFAIRATRLTYRKIRNYQMDIMDIQLHGEAFAALTGIILFFVFIILLSCIFT